MLEESAIEVHNRFMKHLRIIKSVAVVAGVTVVLLAFTACPPEPKWGSVRFMKSLQGEDDILVLRPALTHEDHQDFDKTLATSNKRFFKIVTFKNGQKVRERGTLTVTKVGEVSYNDVVKAGEQGSSDEAWLCDGPSGGMSHQKFIEKMEKVLAKYVQK